MLAVTSSNVAVGVCAISLLLVVGAYARSIFRSEPDAVQAVFLLGSIALALILARVEDGHTAEVFVVPAVWLVIGQFLIPLGRRTPGGAKDEEGGND